MFSEEFFRWQYKTRDALAAALSALNAAMAPGGEERKACDECHAHIVRAKVCADQMLMQFPEKQNEQEEPTPCP